jgi:hypothetical protein
MAGVRQLSFTLTAYSFDVNTDVELSLQGQISGSHGSGFEEDCLLGSCTVLSGRNDRNCWRH